MAKLMTGTYSKRRLWLISLIILLLVFITGCIQQPSKLKTSETPGYASSGITDKYPEQKPDFADLNVKTWAKVFCGSGFDYVTSFQQTSEGGYVVTGSLNSGPTDSSGEKQYDVLLFKVDIDGNKVWERAFGGNENDFAFSLQQTANGGYILGGETRSFEDKTGDAYLIKTDVDGNLQWNRTFDLCGGNESDRVLSVRQTSDGGYISAGVTFSCSQKLWGEHLPWDDSFILKTDANGNMLWERIFGWKESIDQALSVQQTTDGGYVAIGYIHYYDQNGPVYIYGRDIYLVKTDKDGNVLWNKTFGIGNKTALGNGLNDVKVFQQTSDGGYVLAGQGADRRLYLLKADSNGNKVWEKSFWDLNLHSMGYSVKETADGGYFIIGARCIPDYEPRTIIVDSNVILEHPCEFYFLKTDANGNIVSETSGGRTFNGVLWQGQQTLDGGYIIAESVFPRVSATQYAKTTDILMMKLNENGIVCNLTYGQPCTLVPEPEWINNPECQNLVYDDEYIRNPYVPKQSGSE